MNYIFNTSDIVRMILHWLGTPANGYIGVDYARNPRQLLQAPMSEDSSDLLLQWMKEDIPVLKNISDSDLYIAEEVVNFETKRFYIVIGAETILFKTEKYESEDV